MNSPNISIREKIYLATLEVVEKKGLSAATVRVIAKTAGVNIAAINYYFRSKKRLIEEVQRGTVEHFIMDLRNIIHSNHGDIREMLFNFFIFIMDGFVRYPNLSRMHLFQTLLYGRYDTMFMKRLNEVIKDLAEELRRLGCKIEKKRLNKGLVQALSGVMFSAQMPKMYMGFASLNLEEESARKSYVEFVVDDLLRSWR